MRTGSSELPKKALAVVVMAAASGAAAFALSARSLAEVSRPTPWQLSVAAVFGALVLLSRLRPLIIYVDEESVAVHLDEGCLLLLLLLVPGPLTVVAFGAAVALAQSLVRRRFLKAAFNAGQAIVSAWVAASVDSVVAHAVAARPGAGYANGLAAAAGVAAFFVLNNAALATVLAAVGVAWRRALLEGLWMRVVLNAGGVGIAFAGAQIVSLRHSGLAVTVLLLLVLRWALGGFFQARHDRARLEGLFNATLRATSSMGSDDQGVVDSLLASARSLLRCSVAELAAQVGDLGEAAADGTLRAPLVVEGAACWLSVSGRSPSEPFDGADQQLLQALAAVGSAALANAELYEQSQRSRAHLATITSSIGEGVCAVSAEGAITFYNGAAASMLGWDPPSGETATGTDLALELAGTRQAPEQLWRAARRAILARETVASYDTRFVAADGTPIDVACTVSPTFEAGQPVGAVLVFRNVSEHKRLAELTYQAFHDTLTGLPNRRQFLADLEPALQQAEAEGSRHAVLFVDVDRFKIVNDSLGHHAGDLLLIGIAERIQSQLRPGDLLARFGGDEFTILVREVSGERDPVGVAERVLEAVRAPIPLHHGHAVVAGLSIGIALSRPGASADDVLREADVAMYDAKTSRRNGGWRCFDASSMGVPSAQRIELESELRRALQLGELSVAYQPLFAVADRRVVAVEALVRWNHPEHGMLEPSHFVQLAEETGLILNLGRVVLEDACRTAQRFRQCYGSDLVIAVNLSARQFQHAGMLAEIESVIGETSVDPGQLCFEITEGVAVRDVVETRELLTAIKRLGASVAIDDFGTGHSALGYLASFPVDVVKIDRSFVAGIEEDPVKSAIVSAVVTMTRAIGCSTVAEGVETADQLEHVEALGCSIAQGFHLGRPMSAAQLERLLFGRHGATTRGQVRDSVHRRRLQLTN